MLCTVGVGEGDRGRIHAGGSGTIASAGRAMARGALLGVQGRAPRQIGDSRGRGLDLVPLFNFEWVSWT